MALSVFAAGPHLSFPGPTQLSVASVLQAMESWAGPGNDAITKSCFGTAVGGSLKTRSITQAVRLDCRVVVLRALLATALAVIEGPPEDEATTRQRRVPCGMSCGP